MNRKRLLWPLLLMGAFALGVLAAQVQVGTIFLPLVAKASTGPTSSGTVSAENVHCHRTQRECYGELVNETGCMVTAPRVAMYWLDDDGLSVNKMTGRSMAPLLAPGERTPFVVRWYDPLPDSQSYLIYVQWEPVDRLAVDSAFQTTGKSGLWIMTATVRNQLPVRLKSVAVGMVVYNASGEVVGYDGPRELLVPLDPGDTINVSRFFSERDWGDGVEPVGCAAFAIPTEGHRLLLLEQEQ